MAKFYAVGYTNGGANEKRLGPYNSIDEARKAGMREQGTTRGFAFAGVVGENGNYVYSNSRVCNDLMPKATPLSTARDRNGRIVKVGDIVEFGSTKDEIAGLFKDFFGFTYFSLKSAPKLIRPIEDLPRNSVCNSSNPVVQKAIAANSRVARNAAFDDGSVLVSFKTMGPSKMDAIQKRMSSRDFNTWLEKTGNGSKAQEIWYALMQGDEYSFLSGATRVRVKAL